jgi:glycosyltransferase involved in cell wall biosynthesis
MKVLWITHDVLEIFYPFVEGRPTLGSTWLDSLYLELKKNPKLELGILTPVSGGKNQKLLLDNVTFYTIPLEKNSKSFFSNVMSSRYIEQINDFNPDIIHIHGTENNYGLLYKLLPESLPVVISIQGIISSHITFLNYSIANTEIIRFKSIKNWLFYGGVNGFIRNWKKYSKIENEIYINNKYFIGRTDWDKAHLYSLNPKAYYFHGEELLRKSFYENEWNIKTCMRESIFFSSASYSLKGFHVLLKAISILKIKYPNIKVNVPLSKVKIKLSIRDKFLGEDYTIYLGHLVRKYKLQNNINFYNRLNSDQMAEQYKSNHIFVLSSYIENSPNSLGESMLLGCPTICSFVGGTCSIVKDEESTLFFQSGDSVMLANKIDRVFSDDSLAMKLSINAKKIAIKRHDLKNGALQYYNIYDDITALNKKVVKSND